MLNYRYEQIDLVGRPITELGDDVPLGLHCNYTICQVLAALGKHKAWRLPRGRTLYEGTEFGRLPRWTTPRRRYTTTTPYTPPQNLVDMDLIILLDFI